MHAAHGVPHEKRNGFLQTCGYLLPQHGVLQQHRRVQLVAEFAQCVKV